MQMHTTFQLLQLRKKDVYKRQDIQSIVKKAVVESLKKSYLETGLIKEDKEKYPIYVFIHKDKVTLTIDTTGVALHKRGYREKANKAPIRETLAAGIMYLTPWRPGRTLVDPLCGSGTLLIEAAMMGITMAPGLNREFISEKHVYKRQELMTIGRILRYYLFQ